MSFYKQIAFSTDRTPNRFSQDDSLDSVYAAFERLVQISDTPMVPPPSNPDFSNQDPFQQFDQFLQTNRKLFEEGDRIKKPTFPRSVSCPTLKETDLSESDPFDKPRLVRHQLIRTELKKRVGQSRQRLLDMASVMGAIQIGDGPILGGGCMVSDTLFITNKHCADLALTFNLTFTDYSGHEDVIYAYTATPITDQKKYLKAALMVGVKLGPESDVMLLTVDKRPDQFPRISATVTNFDLPIPSSLTHLGFKGGCLHVSVSSERIVSPHEMLARDQSLRGKRLSWSGLTTQAVVENEVRPADDLSLLTARSKGGDHHLELDLESATKTFKNGKRSEIELKVRKGFLVAGDHAIVGHKTGEASSGGSYWDESQPFALSFFGVHCGKVPHQLLAGDPLHHFENHLLLRVGQPASSPFIIQYLKPEAKPTRLNEASPIPQLLGREMWFSSETDQESFGFISQIRWNLARTVLILDTISVDGSLFSKIRVCASDPNCEVKNKDGNISDRSKDNFSISTRELIREGYDIEKEIITRDTKVQLKFKKKDDGACILGVGGSALAAVKENSEKTMIQKFEDCINSREYNITMMTNGSTNTPLFQNVPELADIIGHTGASVKKGKSAKAASGTDVKIYLNETERVVYKYSDRQLWYDKDLSKAATH